MYFDILNFLNSKSKKFALRITNLRTFLLKKKKKIGTVAFFKSMPFGSQT